MSPGKSGLLSLHPKSLLQAPKEGPGRHHPKEALCWGDLKCSCVNKDYSRGLLGLYAREIEGPFHVPLQIARVTHTRILLRDKVSTAPYHSTDAWGGPAPGQTLQM